MKKIIIVLLIGLMPLILQAQKAEGTVYGKISLYFIANKGQVNPQAQFYTKTSLYTLWMTKKGLVFDSPHLPYSPYSPHSTKPYLRDVSRLIFLNANKNPIMVPVDMTGHRVNFLKGREPSKWKTGISTSRAVLYKNLYKDIDLKIYGIEKQIEYDWMVKPGGNPGDIRFAYKHVKGTRLDDEGNLLIETEFGEWVHKKPVGYQHRGQGAGGMEQGAWSRGHGAAHVEVKFKKIAENTYGFEVGDYDKRFELIIDPVVLVYSTYFGGSDWESAGGIAVDSSGSVYVTGYTGSMDFPTENPYQENLRLNQWGYGHDVFITKLSPGGNTLVYSTFLGGSEGEAARCTAVDGSGSVYVAGYTGSVDFPVQNPFQENLQMNEWGYGQDAFVTKLSPSGDTIVYSTFLGGNDWEEVTGIAVDSSGNAYVTGYTNSMNFPTENPFQENLQAPWGYGQDAFVTKLSPSGSTLVYSTYLGGSYWENVYGIAVDSSGHAYVTGFTESTDFPTMNPFQENLQAEWGYGIDAFITKFSPSGETLVYSTYLGGNDWDAATGIAVDNSGNAYVTGITYSLDFPTENPFQLNQGDSDVFVTKLAPSGSSLIYSTYLGGSYQESAGGIAVDNSGNAYVTGAAESVDFPTAFAFQENLKVGDGEVYDAFITKLSPAGNTLFYSTFLGGTGGEGCRSIALDSFGNAYVTGDTLSMDFPVINPHQQFREIAGGSYNVFVSRIQNILLTLQVSRQEERTWLIRKHYVQIRFVVENPGNAPVSNYIVYRKESGGTGTNQYQAVIDIPGPDVQGGSYTCQDLLPSWSNTYTYKVEALDADGVVIGTSEEQTI